jgi:hypothetical protein
MNVKTAKDMYAVEAYFTILSQKWPGENKENNEQDRQFE